jgi:hypothetical protein
MIPWSYDKKVLVQLVVTFKEFINFEGSVKVFLVPPTRDIQCRHGNFIEPWFESLSFPERVIVRMIYEVVPRWQLIVKVFPVCVREWAELEIPLVSIKGVDDVCGRRNLFR